jgi:hypothetical protein
VISTSSLPVANRSLSDVSTRPRAFRMQLAKWKIKRADAEESSNPLQRHGTFRSHPVVLLDESDQNTDVESSESDTETSESVDCTSCNASDTSYRTSCSVLRSAETMPTQPEGNLKFEQMLQQFRDARQSGRDILFATRHATDAAERARKASRLFISAWNEDVLHKRGTLLHYVATQKSASDILETLLAWMQVCKTDVDIKNEDRETALHLAARSGRCNNIEVLLGCGASTVATNKWGQTPLHVSIMSSDKCKATLMLNTGVTARETVITGSSKHAGWCALDLAVEKVFAGFAFNISLCSPLVYGIVPFSAYIVLRTLWTDTEKITKATKRHIKNLAQENVAMSRKLIEALEKFYEVDGFKKQLERALRHHGTSEHRTSRNLD